MDGAVRRIDEDGRIDIPQRLREQLDLEGGDHVRVELRGGTIIVRPVVSRSEFLETMQGCLTDETKAIDAEAVSPAKLKADWTADLPTDEQ